ncbi:MAG: DegT/DnrJ/EryC1/StrS family aminotransferase [Candidatus Latescibacterota bacterium]|nr:DegT/DnrJ/EryC1/StrS family aminotransferase [Candidatus Latescibacterota bacterium]
MEDRIRLFRPSFGDAEVEALRQTLESQWVGRGPRSIEFEERFAEYIGVEHAAALSSCTAALHLALLCAEVEGQEVLTTSMTFVSSSEAILLAGGRPVFCDVEPYTLNMSAEDLARKITPTTRAIVVTHYGGHSCDMDPILELARNHGLTVIEDAAHGAGGSYKGRKLGSLGDIACFSFQATKNMTTGDGGMLVTNDAVIADRVRKLRWCGIGIPTFERFQPQELRRSWMYQVEEVGWKYEMTDISAALGIVQLAKLEANNDRRRQLLDRYREAFDHAEGIELLVQRDYALTAAYNAVIKCRRRDELYGCLDSQGIDSNVHYYPNHLFRIFRPYTTRLPVTEVVWQQILSIPLYADLTDTQQDRVIESILAFDAAEADRVSAHG